MKSFVLHSYNCFMPVTKCIHHYINFYPWEGIFYNKCVFELFIPWNARFHYNQLYEDFRLYFNPRTVIIKLNTFPPRPQFKVINESSYRAGCALRLRSEWPRGIRGAQADDDDDDDDDDALASGPNISRPPALLRGPPDLTNPRTERTPPSGRQGRERETWGERD